MAFLYTKLTERFYREKANGKTIQRKQKKIMQ